MLDQGTLFFVLALLFGLLGIVCGALRRAFGERVTGLGTWALCLLLVTGASALLAAGFAHGRLAVAVQNLFWVPEMALTAVAVRQFTGRSRRVWPMLALAGLVYGLSLGFTGDGREASVRLLLLAGFHVACCLVALHALGRSAPTRTSLARVLMIAGLVLTVLMQVARGVTVLADGGDAASFLSRAGELLVPWFLVFMLVSLLMVTLGFVLASAERIRNDLEALASHDPLTGLLNRRGFIAQSEALFAMARRQGRPVAFALVDLDDFKHVNDSRGHEAGDAVLARLGQLLRRDVRGHDLAARFGGEEFAVLLPLTDAEGARHWAERLRAAIEADLGEGHERVTASIGLAAGGPGEPWDALYRAADQALYRAKAAGKNRVELAAPTARTTSLRGATA